MRLAAEIVATMAAFSSGFIAGAWWVGTRIEALVRRIDDQSEEWRS